VQTSTEENEAVRATGYPHTHSQSQSQSHQVNSSECSICSVDKPASTYTVRQKTAPFHFCNNFMSNLFILQ